MSKFAKLSVVGGVYLVSVMALLPIGVKTATSGGLYDVQLKALGVFIMFGMALLGLSVVAAVFMYAIAKEPHN